MKVNSLMSTEHIGKARCRPSFLWGKEALLQVVGVVIGVLLVFTVSSVFAQTIIDEWATVKAPPPPELKPVTINAKETALLVLDVVNQICNAERRPRCVASVPKIQGLLNQARARGVVVIYSLAGAATVADIWKEVAPLGGEPVVKSSADKFFGTDLEKILKDKGIKTVIAVGSAAHGAVLFTGTEAAKRGFQVIVPVEGMSDSPYTEQYTAWHLVNNPSYGRQVTLTRIDMIKF